MPSQTIIFGRANVKLKLLVEIAKIIFEICKQNAGHEQNSHQADTALRETSYEESRHLHFYKDDFQVQKTHDD